MIGKALQAFLRSDTGKVLVAQETAVALTMVTKKAGELFPADKNAGLASAPGYAPAPQSGRFVCFSCLTGCLHPFPCLLYAPPGRWLTAQVVGAIPNFFSGDSCCHCCSD